MDIIKIKYDIQVLQEKIYSYTSKIKLITQHHNSSWCCLWRNTSCCGRIIDQQEITTGRAAKALSVHGRNICGTIKVQAKRIICGGEIAVKEV